MWCPLDVKCMAGFRDATHLRRGSPSRNVYAVGELEVDIGDWDAVLPWGSSA